MTGAKHEALAVAVLKLAFIFFGEIFQRLAHVFVRQHAGQAPTPVDFFH